MLCYEFAFIIQIVRPLFRWFLAISFDSDIHRDGSGKMLRAKLDCCTFLQEFGTNSDGWAILDCWTGYWPARSWHREASSLHSAPAAASWQPPRGLLNQMFSHHPINILIFYRCFCFYIHRLSSYPHRWVYSGWCWPSNPLFGKQWAILKGFQCWHTGRAHRSFFAVRRRTLK